MLRATWGPVAAFALAGPVLFSACDQAPGFAPGTGRAPVVSNLTVTPGAVRLEDLLGNAPVPAVVNVPITVAATVTDPEGALGDVTLVVEDVAGGVEPILTAALAAQGGGRFGGAATLALDPARTGTYRVLVVAKDAEGRAGEGQTRLTFTSDGRPPVVESATSTVGAGGVVVLTAVVTDPDGLGNVSRVEATGPDGTVFRMYDDGQSFGDPRANDGRFTAAFRVEGSGTLRFTVRATDRGGLRSNEQPVEVTLP